MDPKQIDSLSKAIRDVPDFPKAGIIFKDITPLLADPEMFRLSVDALIEVLGGETISKVVGVDARGFIFGAAVADRLGAGFVPMRKHGKLPYRTKNCSYSLEYGEATIEVHEDAIAPNEKVFLVDDLLATGGTAAAAACLLREMDAHLVAMAFLIELEFLGGRKQLETSAPVHSILTY